MDNCPWPISNVENVINRVSVLENSGKRYIFSDFGYSQGKLKVLESQSKTFKELEI